MKKKILIIGSIVIIILTLMSYTSGIGFAKTETDSKTISPLFELRSNKAVNVDIPTINASFTGKGKEINIPIPAINSSKNTELSLYTVTCGTETIHPQCCHTMIWWACDFTSAP